MVTTSIDFAKLCVGMGLKRHPAQSRTSGLVNTDFAEKRRAREAREKHGHAAQNRQEYAGPSPSRGHGPSFQHMASRAFAQHRRPTRQTTIDATLSVPAYRTRPDSH